jgi:aspartate carbamoyltransferase
MNLLSIDDLSPENIKNLLYVAREGLFSTSRLRHKILATVFFEPSTRTKLSFQSAMMRLGGNIIDLPDSSSLKKGESEEDTIRTLSQYADCLVIRHPKDVKGLAKYSSVPVINAGDGGNEHPTQALLDLHMMAMLDKEVLKIMFTGDLYHSRTINSLVKAIYKYYRVYNAELIFTNEINEDLKQYPHTMIDEAEIPNYIDKVDVLYMTRPQVERHANKSVVSNFVLTNELADKMAKDAIIMHPLPRTKELPPEIDTNHRAKYFEQVKNGLYMRMAILNQLL